MTEFRIESKSNPVIKAAKKLKEKKHRNESRLFLVEGYRLLEEALKSGRRTEKIFYLQEKEEDFRRYIQPNLKEADVYTVPETVLKELSSTVHPQGVVGVVHMDEDSNKTDAGLFRNSMYIYLDGLQDPGNLGTIIRSAHAAEAGGILLGRNTVDPYSDKVLRSSMGSIFHLPIYRDGEMMLKILQNQGYKLAVTSLDATRSIYEEDLAQNLILVIGNEGSGVTKEIQDNAEMLLKIPMPGGAESLNAAVAASVILFEKVRQTQEKSL
ncbi:RNA methyltransferase [Proteiniclasticum sp.]|uniref:TrmH family RNA methyltransferase n=1 Tax=Proteiniclasticum sp. TaxID=2053595 RepID=UPI0028984217|nr:RNA methyltransferase [Proteiniclasticum sp.]